MTQEMRFGICLSVLALLLGCGGNSRIGGGSGPTPTPTPSTSSTAHVFLVVLENHSFSQVIGISAMPYLNSLATQNSLAANYFANTHPSIGNYFMLTTGQVHTNDDGFTGTVIDDNLARTLAAAGKTWKGYFQSIPSQGYLGPD
ncbi:MAG: alkaline phosphatase family protein, partial [Candidatus Angelobacter sp.]